MLKQTMLLSGCSQNGGDDLNGVSLIRQLVQYLVKLLKYLPPLCKHTGNVHSSYDKRSKIMPGELSSLTSILAVVLL